ncbi:MAG: N-acetylmuramoyl-L-alanine amidase [Nitrospira sp.]|nr:N-acetylmuramoyl-L-alanine amidase [Nitrospira sp.]MDH4303583.1 N-acetylmuramoyl-L-alanine amidase [Nitrospira sp.]MDH5195474.1 N-acetylmuramoyl-L-alanine amidase [Nitrospira sp.]
MQVREPWLSLLTLRTLIVSGTLFCLSLPSGVSAEAWASPSDKPRALSIHGSKQSHVRGTPASLAPVTIRNVRATTSPEKIRLVLDLDRQARVIEQRAEDPDRVLIAISDARLSQAAQGKALDGTIPTPFTVTQVTPHAVAVSFSTTSFQSHKHFLLSDPPRLVIDVILPIEQGLNPADVPQETPKRVIPTASQPLAPRTKGYTTIVIDPGHGGKDPGARGVRKTEEKDVTLKVGLQLKKLLSKQPGVRVLMTRDHDVFVELEERARFANSNEADLFVSIHVNSHPSRTVKGIEIYHFGEAKDQRALEVAARENGTPISNTGVGWEYLVADLLTTKKIEESLELAWNAKAAMVAQMNGHYEVDDHGVKTAPFYVLRFTSMPSILAEIAYISNPSEEELLHKPAFVRDVAQSLYQGIVAFLSASKSDIR